MDDNTSADKVLRFFVDHVTVKFVRLHWVDYSGVLRLRTITSKRCIDIASKTSSYHVAQNCMVMPISTDPRCWPDGIEDWTLWPDWSSLMICGFRPSHASVMCFMGRSLSQSHGDKDVGMSMDKSSFERCPRTLLYQVIDSMHQVFQQRRQGPKGMTLLMGFEIEFVLLETTSLNLASTPSVSADPILGYSTVSGLRTTVLDILEEVIAALQTSGTDIYHFHVETGDQIEIALEPKPPLEAIDALMMAQETIRTVFLRHQLKASMAPRPVLHHGDGHDTVMNGCHFHLSLNHDGIDAQRESGAGDGIDIPVGGVGHSTTAPGDDGGNQSFLAGVLQKLGGLCAFGMPSYDSYCRVQGDCAGEWIGWGTHNKDMPIRQFHENRWEFRFLDVTANVYLFVAAVFAAGTAGVRAKLPLAIRDCQILPSTLRPGEAEERLEAFGITERMPTSLQGAIQCAQADADLHTWIGTELWDQYMKVKGKEVEYFSACDDAQRRAKFVQYF